jgi:hypothetical protein
MKEKKKKEKDDEDEDGDLRIKQINNPQNI